MTGCDLFLLAHPDDDLFFRPLLAEDSKRLKLVAYLTNGRVPGPVTPAQRREEAKRALSAFNPHEVLWCGIDADIDVYSLPHHIDEAYALVAKELDGRAPVDRVFTHAWEGGHPDHDAAHLIALAIARERNIMAQSFTTPFYRAPKSGLLPFVVMTPLPENGEVVKRPMKLGEAGSILKGMVHYPSQLVPLLGLSPGMLYRTLFKRTLPLQRLDQSVAPRRPVKGRLLYERRNGLTFDQFADLTRNFSVRHVSPPRQAG